MNYKNRDGYFPRVIIAGLRGGSGKTTVSLAVTLYMRRRKGLKVIPFKKGPDFIDAAWLSAAAQNNCYNLDPFLISNKKTINSFIAHFDGDVALIEGNRGLYDGMDVSGSYSTASLSKTLKSPVVLVLDCSKVTRTAAAMVLGCKCFDPDVNIVGVILNNIAGKRHELIVRDSIEKYSATPVLGAIPRFESSVMPERHMGLTAFYEHAATNDVMEKMTAIAESYIDVNRIIQIANEAARLDLLAESYENDSLFDQDCHHEVKIGVLRDRAFQFYYPENIEGLIKCGAKIVYIDATADAVLPDMDALYIGGGFPETNAIQLAANESFRVSLRAAIEIGLPVYAECGGLMFLGRSIWTKDGEYPMVGIFPVDFKMKDRPMAHGYTIVEVCRANPFYPVGTVFHGHEFHYSKPVLSGGISDSDMIFKMKRGHGIAEGMDGLCYKNVVAAYTHVHALGAPEWVKGLVTMAQKYRVERSLPDKE